jgi:hypothetical protein
MGMINWKTSVSGILGIVFKGIGQILASSPETAAFAPSLNTIGDAFIGIGLILAKDSATKQ